MKRIKFLKIIVFTLIVLGICVPISFGSNLTMSTSKSNAESGETITITINGNGITGKVALSATGGTLSEGSVWLENSKSTATVKVTGNSDVKIVATPVDISDSNTGEQLSSIGSTSATIKVAKKEEQTNDKETKEEVKKEEVKEEPKQEEKSNNNDEQQDNNLATSEKNNTTTATSTEAKPKQETKQVTFKDTNETMYTSSRVNLRNEYGTKGTVYRTLSEGEELIRTGYTTTNVDGYSWSRVKYNGGTYYCITRSLTATKPEVADKEEVKEEPNEKANETTENTTKQEESNTVNETAQTVSNEIVGNDLKKLEIIGYTLDPTFKANIYEYKIEIPQDVSELEVKTEAGNSNVQIEVAGNKDLKDSENVITVVCNNKETKKTSTYQVIVTKKANENPHAEAINEAMKKRNLIIKVGIGIIIILIILCVIVFKKGNEEEDDIIESYKGRSNYKRQKNEQEEKLNDEFKQLLEKKKIRKENSNVDDKIKKQNTRIKGKDVNSKKVQHYDDEERLEQIRRKRIAEKEEKRIRQNMNNSDEDLPKGLRKENFQENKIATASKTQNDRADEFDEKLYRIRRERRIEKKGGKHF